MASVRSRRTWLQVTPFGPFKGSDDVHNFILFDLLDKPERCFLAAAESPAEGATHFRGRALPPVGRRRIRNRSWSVGEP